MQRYIAIIVGIIMIAVGGFLFYKNSYLKNVCTVESVATVVDMKEELSTDSNSTTSYMYYPIIEYSVNGDTIRVTMDQGSSTPPYSINEKINILYNPNKTKEFIVKGDKMSNIMSIVVIALGVFVTGYGIVIAFKKEN